MLQRSSELYERAGSHRAADALRQQATLALGEAGAASQQLVDIPEERQQLEQQLAGEPEGPARLELLRRLLRTTGRDSDMDQIDGWSQEILARAPDDLQA